MKRTDERDVIFSRMNYKSGSPAYEDYYARHPEHKDTDDEIRSLPEMGSEGTIFYDRINTHIVNSAFRFLSDGKGLAGGTPNAQRTEVTPDMITRRIKGLARYYGAKLVGITQMKESHYYSHRGREEEDYGYRITDMHRYGIAFAVEMDRDLIHTAPRLPESIAVTKGYIDAAVIGMVLSYFIRELGYPARNHMDGNYLVVAPLVAQDAGLGEIGRSGLLITKTCGPRVRLGVVTTDMPLLCDEPKSWGLKEFCDECALCARHCPASAIPKGERVHIDGVHRWKINSDDCYRRWRISGTDCGMCLAACPLGNGILGDDVEALKESHHPDSVVQAMLKEYRKGKAGEDLPEWLT